MKNQADVFTSEEKWEDLSKTYSDIYLITNEDSDKELLDSAKTLTKRLSSLKQITNEPTKSLNTQDKVDSARWLLKELKKFSNTETPILSASIIDFELLIDSYQELITEDANRKKNNNKVASNNSNPNNSSQRTTSTTSNTNPSSSSSTRNAGSTTGGAKLDMASFISNVACKERTRNKQMSTQFEITVLSSGRASNVKLLNSDDLKPNSRDKDAIDEVIAALKRAKYEAAKSGNIAVTSTLIKKLNIPKNSVHNLNERF